MVLPKCETSLKVYDTAEFGLFYRYPQDSQKLQKLIDKFRECSNRNHTTEADWATALRDYIARQAVGPLGIDNEALRFFVFGDCRNSNATPGQPVPTFSPLKADSATNCRYCQSKMHDSAGCIVYLLSLCKKKSANACSSVFICP